MGNIVHLDEQDSLNFEAMARRSPLPMLALVGAASLLVLSPCFIPTIPSETRPWAAAAGSAAVLGSTPAFADPIGDAAKKLGRGFVPLCQGGRLEQRHLSPGTRQGRAP